MSKISQSKGENWNSLFIYRNTAASLNFLELNIVLKEYLTKSEKNQPHTTYLEYNLMILLCVDSIVSLS